MCSRHLILVKGSPYAAQFLKPRPTKKDIWNPKIYVSHDRISHSISLDRPAIGILPCFVSRQLRGC